MWTQGVGHGDIGNWACRHWEWGMGSTGSETLGNMKWAWEHMAGNGDTGIGAW